MKVICTVIFNQTLGSDSSFTVRYTQHEKCMQPVMPWNEEKESSSAGGHTVLS